MYHRILVPLDGSLLAERVLPYVEILAKRSRASVVLFQASAGAIVRRIEPATGKTYPLDPAMEYLDRVAARLAERDLTAEVDLVEGDAADAIVQAAATHGADLIAMSTHGRSGLGRWLYGSVADQVLRRARVPVLVVPVTADLMWTEGRSQPALVPLDGSGLAQAALNPASVLAETLGSPMILLEVIEPPVYPYSEIAGAADFDPAPLVVEARTYLEQTAATLRARGHTVTVQVEVGAAAETIATVAREQEAGAIVMATHGRGGLARLVLGSVATATLQRAGRPLLLVRPPALYEPVPMTLQDPPV